jgi:hypothetical protein
MPNWRSERHPVVLDLAALGIPLLPSHYPIEVEPASLVGHRFVCSCREATCPTPARHLPGALTRQDATTDPERLARWWRGPAGQANLVTVAGWAFDVIELSFNASAEQVAAWLRAHDLEAGPVIDTGATTRFLVQVGMPAPCYAPLRSGWLAKLRHGELVLLPPSRSISGRVLVWRTGPSGIALPDGEELYRVLLRLPMVWGLAAGARPQVGKR